MKTIRIIRDSKYPAPMGLAIDEALLKSLKDGLALETVRFYYFAPPAVVVGLNQDINLINLEYLRNKKMSFGRRLTGGGAIIIGCPDFASQMGITFLFRLDSDLPEKLSQKFKFFSSVMMDALKNIGVEPEYNRNSDITVRGRKIAGNGIYMTEEALLFHSIILFDYDYDVMYQVLNLAHAESEEKIIERMKKQITTLNFELGQTISPKTIENQLINGIKAIWKCDIREEGLSKREKKIADKLYREKYSTNSWNFQNLDDQGLRNACFVPDDIDLK